MAGKSKTKDTGLKAFKKGLRNLPITIGVHEREGRKIHPNSDTQTVGEIARAHELGIGVPRRSWLHDWMQGPEFQAAFKQGVQDAMSADSAFEAIGNALEASCKERILKGDIPPPNAPSTIAAKGHAKTLVDTETFVDSITYQVKR